MKHHIQRYPEAEAFPKLVRFLEHVASLAPVPCIVRQKCNTLDSGGILGYMHSHSAVPGIQFRLESPHSILAPLISERIGLHCECTGPSSGLYLETVQIHLWIIPSCPVYNLSSMQRILIERLARTTVAVVLVAPCHAKNLLALNPTAVFVENNHHVMYFKK